MTDTDLARLIALAEAATPGTWTSDYEAVGSSFRRVFFENEEGHGATVAQWLVEQDAEYLCAANPSTVVALCQALQRARALLGEALPWVEIALVEDEEEYRRASAVRDRIRAELGEGKLLDASKEGGHGG